MAHYLLAQVKVKDDSWIPDFAANDHGIVHRQGGKYQAPVAYNNVGLGASP